MKTLFALMMAVGLSLAWNATTAADEAGKKVTATFVVEGMTCGGCEFKD